MINDEDQKQEKNENANEEKKEVEDNTNIQNEENKIKNENKEETIEEKKDEIKNDGEIKIEELDKVKEGDNAINDNNNGINKEDKNKDSNNEINKNEILEIKITEEKNEQNEKKENMNNEDNKDNANENNENKKQKNNEKEEPNKNVINIINEDNKNIEEDLKKVQLPESKDDAKYLANLEEEKELQNLINEQLKNNDDDEDSDEEEETFPFRFLGDVQKKGEVLGLFNNRYLEIDSAKGLIKRYASSKEYPNNPMESIPIQSLKTLKKIKKQQGQEYYEFQLTFSVPGKKKDKLHIYRVRHAECRSKWFESLLKLWKHLVKGESLPPINNHKLIFIDDQVGINQEIKQKKNKNKKKNEAASTVCLRNFKILAILGVGGFGTVFKVQHILTEKIYAMKVMNKNFIIQKKYLHYVVSEFEIMKMLSGFPFVLDLHYCFQSANYLYMVIDICPGGDFTDLKYINNLKLFLAEVILAFEHIHNHSVVYRDLKPENILLDSTGHIKICDFNLAKSGISKQKRATSFCGSPMYLSPEMLDPEGVDQRCDIYGIGLLLYELVTDKPAYMAKNINQLYEKIKANQINFDLPSLKGDVKDLLQKILVADPEKRISIEEIKKHPYFHDISFLKVYKKEYGPIITKKKDKSEINENDPQKLFSKNILQGGNEEEEKKKEITEDEDIKKEKKSEDEFKEQQKKLDANKEYSFLDGKISVREMKKDQKRAMKNYVREFYYVKKEDTPQTEEFTLTVNGFLNTQDL
jgi:serine/threonine protein kinase